MHCLATTTGYTRSAWAPKTSFRQYWRYCSFVQPCSHRPPVTRHSVHISTQHGISTAGGPAWRRGRRRWPGSSRFHDRRTRRPAKPGAKTPIRTNNHAARDHGSAAGTLACSGCVCVRQRRTLVKQQVWWDCRKTMSITPPDFSSCPPHTRRTHWVKLRPFTAVWARLFKIVTMCCRGGPDRAVGQAIGCEELVRLRLKQRGKRTHRHCCTLLRRRLAPHSAVISRQRGGRHLGRLAFRRARCAAAGSCLTGHEVVSARDEVQSMSPMWAARTKSQPAAGSAAGRKDHWQHEQLDGQGQGAGADRRRALGSPSCLGSRRNSSRE